MKRDHSRRGPGGATVRCPDFLSPIGAGCELSVEFHAVHPCMLHQVTLHLGSDLFGVDVWSRVHWVDAGLFEGVEERDEEFRDTWLYHRRKGPGRDIMLKHMGYVEPMARVSEMLKDPARLRELTGESRQEKR